MQYIRIYLSLFFISFIFQQTCHAKQIITNPRRSDGFGGQFQTIIYSVIYAELNNADYVYTPFSQMEHNYDNDSDFIAKKEWLINFIDNFEINKDNAIFPTTYFVTNFFEQNLNACYHSLALQKIKTIFKTNKKRDMYFDGTRFNIVVHLRRHNAHDCRIDGTDTPNSTYLEIINKLRKVYENKNPIFHIHSQGNENFEEFNASDIIFYLDTTVEDSFISMVFADVLVTSRSSFSYTAGIISEGTVYYMPFWHPPMPNWISIPEFLRSDNDS